jgi:anti-anti-sigma factor
MQESEGPMVLEDLRVDEVSLVDRAANGRRFLIWKRNGGKHKMHDTIQAVADTATEKEEALISSVAKLEMSDDARSALTAAHRLLEGFADEIGEEALAAFAAASGIIVAAPVDDPAAVAEDELSDEVAADEAVIKTAEIEPILKAALDRIAELESVAKAAEAAAELTADVARCADPPLVILDLSHTKYFGSAFIEILFRAWNRLKGRDGGRFCISGLTPYCKEVIEVTHLNELWKIFDTLDQAIADLKSGE